jgi:hypothetical protein
MSALEKVGVQNRELRLCGLAKFPGVEWLSFCRKRAQQKSAAATSSNIGSFRCRYRLRTSIHLTSTFEVRLG